MIKRIFFSLVLIFLCVSPALALESSPSAKVVTPTLSPLSLRSTKLQTYQGVFVQVIGIETRLESRIAKMKALNLKVLKQETDLKKIKGDTLTLKDSIATLSSQLSLGETTPAKLRTYDASLKKISFALTTLVKSEKLMIQSLKKISPILSPTP